MLFAGSKLLIKTIYFPDLLDEACPVAPELVIEIISPGQTFGDLAEKSADYLQAGVSTEKIEISWLLGQRAMEKAIQD